MCSLTLEVYLIVLRCFRRQLVEGLIKSMGACKRCENCGAFSPNIRKDGSNKLFQVQLSVAVGLICSR